MSRYFQRILNGGRHKHFIDYLADVNSGITAIALFPQLFMLFGDQKPTGLSPLSFVLVALNSCIWTAYGIHRKTPPLIVSSALNVLASVGILVLIFLKRSM